MTRYASSTNQAEGSALSIRAFVAVDLDFPSGHVYAHDGTGVLTWGGHDYLGVGSFGGIDTADESIDIIAKPLVLSLSGVDASLLSTATTEQIQNRSATVYLGFIDSVTGQPKDTPEMVWEGRMDQMPVSLDTGVATIKIRCEPRLRRGPQLANYTDADLQLRYSGDLFFNLLGKIAGFRGTWGAKGVANDGGSMSSTGHWENHGRANVWVP